MFSNDYLYEQSEWQRHLLNMRDAIGENVKISQRDNEFDPPTLRFYFPDGYHVEVVIQGMKDESEIYKMIARVKQMRSEYLRKTESKP